ncbi:hypothetical protein [Mesorhizobium sp.]|nr:hypothetical protein [Mesorhizobium sp.]
MAPKTFEGQLLAARQILVWYDTPVPGKSLDAMMGEHVLASSIS